MFDTSTTEDPAWLDGLNDRQREAVLHGDGPLLVIAGAGSGKTRTLASRVARLVDEGVPADRILLLTFTRRAAAEMLRRSGALISDRSVGKVWGGTFHAVANRLLRRYGSAVGLQDGFTVIDQSDAASLFGMIRAELGYSGSKQRFPKKETIAAVYSRTVNARTPLTETVEESLRPLVVRMVREPRVVDVHHLRVPGQILGDHHGVPVLPFDPEGQGLDAAKGEPGLEW